MSDDVLGSLGIAPDDFPHLSQHQLEVKLDSCFPQYIDDSKLLDIYMKWLAKQIPRLGLRCSDDSSKIVRDCCDFLSTRNYDKGVVINAFSRLKKMFLEDYPDCARTFNLARRDIEINYKKLPVPSSTLVPSSARVTPDAAPLSTTPIRPVYFPPSLGVPPIFNWGANQPSSNEALLVHRQKALGLLGDGKSSSSSGNMMFVPSTGTKGAPPATYVCNRCGQPGHYIQDCETNGNILFDRPPPKDYVCRICGERESHFVTSCPQKQPYTSMTPINNGLHSKSASRNRDSKRSSAVNGSYISGESRDSRQYDIAMDSKNVQTGRGTPDRMEGMTQVSEDITPRERKRRRSSMRTPKNGDDHMNEERARYIQSHTDRYRPAPQVLGQMAGGGPMRSGSNNDPIGRRRRVDSYRPDLKKKQETVSKSKSSNNEGLVLRPARGSSDGRLSPWDDIQRPLKKRPRDDSPVDEGLPWDDFQTPPKKRSRDPHRHSTSGDACLLTGNGPLQGRVLELAKLREKDSENEQVSFNFPQEYEEAAVAADSFLETFEREVAHHPYGQIRKQPATSEVADENDDSAFYFTASSSFSSDESLSSPEKPAMGDAGDIYMVGDPHGEKDPNRGMSEMGHDTPHCIQAIKPFETFNPLLRDPPYDRCVLDIFRGLEHTLVYVNVLHRRTAIEMYEEGDQARTTNNLSYLAM